MPGIEWEVKWWKREKESGVKKVNKKVGKGKKGRKEGEKRWMKKVGANKWYVTQRTTTKEGVTNQGGGEKLRESSQTQATTGQETGAGKK